MTEVRYAILIGMDNYKKNPLSYSVKDVRDLQKVLINNCRFLSENIFIITDSTEPIIEQIDRAYKTINIKFKRGADLFLFYYSGHGEYDEKKGNSLLNFEDDTTLEIGKVAENYFNPIKAKNEYLIIDACHSGTNIFIKPKSNVKKEERKLLANSKETYFLFAAQKSKKAYQDDKLQNSYFTYYFIKAIKDEKLYDEKGFLTMSAINENVRMNLSNHTKENIQIPGSESRSVGYKPFAILKQAKKNQTELHKKDLMNEKPEFDLEQSLSSDNRTQIQLQLKKLLQSKFESFTVDVLSDEYDVQKKNGYDGLSYELQEKLEKSIIQKASVKDLSAINEMFKVKLVSKNKIQTSFSTMFEMINGKPEPEYSYDITYNEDFVIASFIELKAKRFDNVSGGLFNLLYQAKYGFVYCKTLFKYEWDGTHEKISDYIKTELTPFLLKNENIEKVKQEIVLSLNELAEKIREWNDERKVEIQNFLKKVK